jgi:hypothetical protein
MTDDCPVGIARLRRGLVVAGSLAAAFLILIVSIVLITVGVSIGQRDERGAQQGGLIQRVHEWFFPPPPCVLGEAPPVKAGGN